MNYLENKGESQGWDHPSSQRTKQCLPKMSPVRSFNGFYMKSEQNTGRAKPRVWAALTIHRSHQTLYSLALKLATSHAEGCSPWFFAYHSVALSIIYISSLLLSGNNFNCSFCEVQRLGCVVKWITIAALDFSLLSDTALLLRMCPVSSAVF